VTLTINGEEKSFAGGLSLADLIQQMGMKPDRVAVELNREIVSRSAWPTTQLKEGDRLEIVHFVGGGQGSDFRHGKAFSPRRRGAAEELKAQRLYYKGHKGSQKLRG
jgi:sulfur carrier protein